MSHPSLYCPVCQQGPAPAWARARDYEYFSTGEEEFTYYHCGHCGTLFIDPVPVEKLKQIYPPNYYSFVSSSGNMVTRIKEWLDKRFLRKILRDLPAEKIDVLDVGGGTGWILDLLKKTDRRVGFTQIADIDEKAKETAIKNGHAYFQGTVEEFETDRKFHLILMLNLIEHVQYPLLVLKKAASLLHPGGILLIKTPNTDSWDARLFRKTYWGGLHCPRHWVIFSEKSFRRVAAQTGLCVKKLEYTQGAPFWAFSIIAALSRKKIIHTSAQAPVIFHWLFAPLSGLFALFDFLRKPFAKTSQLFIQLTREEKQEKVC
ncbi:MAG: class I SAM-dependent methyltransferase [Sphingobacteriales bacterium]|nr:class I SAM-dependent methyltransferase [Sphingobacteriales bacterium]